MTTPSDLGKLLPTPGPAMVVDTFSLIVERTSEWVTVIAQEQTRREGIRSWEAQQLAAIHVQQEFLLTALDKTFDERRENFRRLFDQLDAALVSDRDDAAAQVAGLLEAITELAKTSPFKDLKSPELVVREFLQSGREIEL